MEHEFTKKIREILEKNFGALSDKVLSESPIIQYLNIKTKSQIGFLTELQEHKAKKGKQPKT